MRGVTQKSCAPIVVRPNKQNEKETLPQINGRKFKLAKIKKNSIPALERAPLL